MEAEPHKAEPPKRKRRWFQFSLRTLMIVVVIVAIPYAWLGRKIERKRKEREAVQGLRAFGGQIWYDFQWAINGPVDYKAEPSGATWLRDLMGENFFNEVIVVDLRDTAVTDAELESVGGFSQLVVLNLHGTKVTDVGMRNIKSLTKLHDLVLGGTQISDNGLEILSGLTQLQYLWLNNTKVSNAGLTNVKELSQLQVVWLSHSQVTDAGAKDLHKALPNCQILR